MRNLTATLCLTIAVLLGSVGMSASADFQKGLTAYQSSDYLTALQEFRPLAEQGHANAQFYLGNIYRIGLNVRSDYKTALKWYRLAAEQGHTDAQNDLGWMYDHGRGVLENDKTAVKWYRLAAEQGDDYAQYNLGEMYNLGKGVLKDYVYAHMWGNIAAMNGSELGAKLRDDFEKKMTPSQLEKAQDLARECVRKKYNGC